MEYKQLSAGDACSYLINEKMKDIEGDVGVIVMDSSGDICSAFNSVRMIRGWQKSSGAAKAFVYAGE